MSCIPVIDGKTVIPSRIAPGGTATITICARDLCAAEGTLQGTLRDSLGEETPISVTVRTGGVLRYRLTAPRGTIVQDPIHPNVFHFTAPADTPAPSPSPTPAPAPTPHPPHP